jgi:hypothetical protein
VQSSITSGWNDLSMTTLYTIGYEGTDIDRFVATLKAVGVHLLADVRALPLSRKRVNGSASSRYGFDIFAAIAVSLGGIGSGSIIAHLHAISGSRAATSTRTASWSSISCLSMSAAAYSLR